MQIQILYILDCKWCVRTKKLIRESLKELGVKAGIREIMIDTNKKAKKYNFTGSPTVRINGKDIQEEVEKGKCISCEELAENGASEFARHECRCGCRKYSYKGKQYSYPPKGMIKEAVSKISKEK